MPRKEKAKLKALQQTIELTRTAIKAKRWHQARYMLSRARALVNALPAEQTAQHRQQLSELRKKFEARNTTAAKNARSAKVTKKPISTPAAVSATGKKSTAKKSTAKSPTQEPKLTPARDLGNRYINRAALGYTPTDEA
ncbi:hypothetical protein [Streptomyces sp. NBC_01373]|uniref:hypothetical protein n=1 Tax=Streptomyces sp. NBC_01373 TaxID=2903843 RepID=UPI002253CBBC|nr:hypothetical protein [Streptomyces sp. NBC_01373]MCX4701231.1 hypothetical protein [Streptomyces sp. NBC_01373]